MLHAVAGIRATSKTKMANNTKIKVFRCVITPPTLVRDNLNELANAPPD
jgi:hypothetical protein